MGNFITHIGMDTDKKGYDIAIAEGFGSENQEVRSWGRIPATPDALRKLVRQLRAKGHTRLHFVYEAGPCGYNLYRQLKALGEECAVIAPSMIPVKPGERVKTNRRDAIKLARLDRSGELTEVNVPDEGDEAVRDLVRGRGASVQAATRVKLQIKGLLLRNGLTYTGTGERWSWQYRNWLKTIKFEHPAQDFVLQEWLVALAEAETRVERLTEQIKELLPKWRMHEVVKALQALRGVALLSAVQVVAEVGDMTRFKNPRELMAYLGLVPSEHSTGEKRRQGSITKSGNIRARQTLVESSWAYSKRPQLTRALQVRQKGLSSEVIQISWKAQVRLCSRYKKLTSRGKSTRKAVVAVARELCAFMWAIAKAVDEKNPQQAV